MSLRLDRVHRRVTINSGRIVLTAILAFLPYSARGGGILGIDHRVGEDESGIWARNNQKFLGYGAILAGFAGGIWYGRDSELGRVFWQTVDASAISGLGAQALKFTFGRQRPRQTSDPNEWFSGHGNQSFPSGEVTLQAAFVTPFIVHYSSDHPWVWALEVLPAYMAVARVKSRAHWQSDVVAGWALGSAVGYWTAKRSDSPFSVQILPNALTIGWRRDF
jgi:membrane-associated phospholipid phosphatase